MRFATETLVAMATHYIDMIMAEGEEVVPNVFIHTGKGVVAMMFKDKDRRVENMAKMKVRSVIKFLGMTDELDGVAVVGEAWMAKRKELATIEVLPARLDPDRVEIVHLEVHGAEGRKVMAWEIKTLGKKRYIPYTAKPFSVFVSVFLNQIPIA